MTTLHDVKIEPRWFDRIQQNEKFAEVRYDDRDYQTGDRIRFWRNDTTPEYKYCVERTITHVLRSVDGLDEGYVVLSLSDPRVANLQARLDYPDRSVPTARTVKPRAARREHATQGGPMNAVWRRRREGSAPVEPTRSGRPVRASQPVPGLRSRARRLVRRNRREQSHPRPAPITPALRALLFQSAGTVLMLAGAAAAGVGIGALVLGVGITAAAWIAVAVSVLVLVVGAVDHVWTRP